MVSQTDIQQFPALFYRMEDTMRIDFYDARITDHDRTVLVKEKGIFCFICRRITFHQISIR